MQFEKLDFLIQGARVVFAFHFSYYVHTMITAYVALLAILLPFHLVSATPPLKSRGSTPSSSGTHLQFTDTDIHCGTSNRAHARPAPADCHKAINMIPSGESPDGSLTLDAHLTASARARNSLLPVTFSSGTCAIHVDYDKRRREIMGPYPPISYSKTPLPKWPPLSCRTCESRPLESYCNALVGKICTIWMDMWRPRVSWITSGSRIQSQYMYLGLPP